MNRPGQQPAPTPPSGPAADVAPEPPLGPDLIGKGYEGLDLASLITDLAAAGVQVLVDVRLTPISRKPGLSKRSLAEALRHNGIEYRHHPSLGNPKPNRAGFAGNAHQLQTAQDLYRQGLVTADALGALEDIRAALAAGSRVALLCFEADQTRCHRGVLLHELREPR